MDAAQLVAMMECWPVTEEAVCVVTGVHQTRSKLQCVLAHWVNASPEPHWACVSPWTEL